MGPGLEQIIDPSLRSAWSRNATDLELQLRVAILSARGDPPSDHWQADQISQYRRLRAAWDIYVTAAHHLGLFDGAHGIDLAGRLRSRESHNFRSGLGECMAAWLLAGPLRLEVETRPTGRPGRVLEFAVVSPGTRVQIEVKYPQKTEGSSVDETALFEGALGAANQQFATGVQNVLVLARGWDQSEWRLREMLTDAFFGHAGIGFRVDKEAGILHETGPAFRPDGRFLRLWRQSTALRPRYTRTGGVLLIHERDGGDFVRHQVLYLQNPFAENAVPLALWGDIPMLVQDGDVMRWTDAEPQVGNRPASPLTGNTDSSPTARSRC